MNLKIIQTPNYILGVDKEAKKGEKGQWVIETHNPIVESVCQLNGDWDLTRSGYKDKLIIAHLPLNGNKQLEGVWLLPDYQDDIDDRIRLKCEGLGEGDTYNNIIYTDGFVDGYKAAGGYTEEDMKKAFMQGMKGEGCTALYIHFEEFIQSLKPFPIEFEVEMEEYGYEPVIGKFPNYEVNPNPKLFRPKILNNIIQGKYIWKQLN